MFIAITLIIVNSYQDYCNSFLLIILLPFCPLSVYSQHLFRISVRSCYSSAPVVSVTDKLSCPEADTEMEFWVKGVY